MGKFIQVYYIFQFVMEILTFEIFNLFNSCMSIYPMSVIHYEMSDNFHFWSFSIPQKKSCHCFGLMTSQLLCTAFALYTTIQH